MFDFVSPLLGWLNTHPEWAGFVTFVISASESVAIIGTIIPGSITMTALGALAGAGVIPLWETLFFATLGAIVGDGISYWMGHFFKNQIPRLWPFNQNLSLLKRGELFVNKYGIMSVFIGRFIGPVRALVPLIAGMLGMKPLQFTIANVTSAIGWAPAYLLPGMLLGAASMELPPDIALNVILVLLLVLLFISLCFWVFYKLIRRIKTQISNMEVALWQWFKTYRIGHSITVWLAHHNHANKQRQFSLALLFVLTVLTLLTLTLSVKLIGASNISINEIGYNFFRSIRGEQADAAMLFITLFGQKEVLVSAALIIIGWLLLTKHYRTATHIGLLVVMTAAFVFIMKNSLQSERPWGILQPPDNYSLPSGHAALSFAILFGLSYFSTRTLQKSMRLLIYIPSIILVSCIGISRLYLGAHWMTDVLIGWLLGASVLTFMIMSYERYKDRPVNGPRLLVLSIIAISLSCFTFYQFKFQQLQIRYTKIDWPTLTLNENSWWETGMGMPKKRTSLFGFRSKRVNIEWAGNLDKIEATLKSSGWSKPPARDFISTLHRIADISSTQYLPMVSPQYLEDKPMLILAKKESRDGGLLVIRLWDGHRRFKNNGLPLWVGVIDRVPRSYSWLFQNRHGELDINARYIFPTPSLTSPWEWKIVPMPITHHHKKSSANTMLLRQI